MRATIKPRNTAIQASHISAALVKREVCPHAPHHHYTTACQVAGRQRRNPCPGKTCKSPCKERGWRTCCEGISLTTRYPPTSAASTHSALSLACHRFRALWRRGPETTDQLEANGKAYPMLAALNENPASLADDALRPKDSIQEPSSVILHARISAGVRRQLRYLRRPFIRIVCFAKDVVYIALQDDAAGVADSKWLGSNLPQLRTFLGMRCVCP